MIISLFMQETPESVGVPHAARTRMRDGRDNDPPGQPAREARKKQQRHVIFHYRDSGSGPGSAFTGSRITQPAARSRSNS
jgi:hypothetical protein